MIQRIIGRDSGMSNAFSSPPLGFGIMDEPSSGQHGRDVDLLAMQAEAAAGGDDDIAVMSRRVTTVP
jgi:hypothetical protein